MSLTLKNSQQATLTLAGKDKRGQAAEFDGTPQWDTSDATIATVEPDTTDGRTAVVKATGLLGDCKISATVDADMGAGFVALVGSLDVTVIAGDATVVELQAGAPEEQA